jgi:hypothetical protein
VGGSSIPIAIKIALDPAKYDPAKYSGVTVALEIGYAPSDTGKPFAGKPVLTAKFKDQAVADGNISLMTRLKVPFKEYFDTPQPFSEYLKANNGKDQSPPQFKIAVKATTAFLDKNDNPATDPKFDQTTDDKLPTITIKKEDCATADVAVLRLALKPPGTLKAKDRLAVKAVVPSPGPSRVLDVIDCQRQKSQTPPFHLQTASDAKFLSDEVFVGFDLFPQTPDDDLLTMTWTYKDTPPNNTVTASAQVHVTNG